MGVGVLSVRVCAYTPSVKVKGTDVVYEERGVCERGSIPRADSPPKDSGTQCETEQSALPWDKYRLDIARGS